MEESKEQEQTSFSLQSLLSKDSYKMQENLYKKNITKNYRIQYQNNLIAKLHSSVLEEVEFMEALNMFQKNQQSLIEIPKHCNPNILYRVIYYFYFLEVKTLPFHETFDLLDLAILFKIEHLIEKLVSYLKENITNVKQAISIRLSLFFLVRRSNFEISDRLNKIIADCETFLLQKNYVEEYLSFYSHQYFTFTWDSEIADDLFSRLRLMKNHKIEGVYLLKLVALFKERLVLQKKSKGEEFNFKAFVERILIKYIKLGDIEEIDRNKAFERLGLDVNDFKIHLANEKIADLEKRESQNNETINMLQNQMICLQKIVAQQLCDIKEQIKTMSDKQNIEFEVKFNEQRNRSIEEISKTKTDFRSLLANLKNEHKISLNNQKIDYKRKINQIQKESSEIERDFNSKLTKTQMHITKQKILMAPIIEKFYLEIDQQEKKYGQDMEFDQIKTDFYFEIADNQNRQLPLSPIMEKFYDKLELKRQTYFEQEKQRIDEQFKEKKPKKIIKLNQNYIAFKPVPQIQKEKQKKPFEIPISFIKTINIDHEKHLNYLAKLLQINSLDELTSKLFLLYRGSENNFDASKFHELCDGKGPTIVLVRSTNKQIFGGYATASWNSDNKHSNAPGSFLFSLSKQTKHEIIKGKEGCVIVGLKGDGPTFGGYSFNIGCYGGHDLLISHNCNLNTISYSQLGNTYSLPYNLNFHSNEAKTYFSGSNSYKFQVEEYEVYSYENIYSNEELVWRRFKFRQLV